MVQHSRTFEGTMAATTPAGASTPRPAGSKSERTVTTLREEAAVSIFVAKHSGTHTARDSLASELAIEHSITSKSVRGEFASRLAQCTAYRAPHITRRGAQRV